LGTFVVAILGLALGASQGLAGAAGNDTTATARIQKHNGHCGRDTGKPFIGKARLTLAADGTLSIKVQLGGADPGVYDIDVFAGDGSCGFIEIIDQMKVDSSGHGSKVVQTCCYSRGLYFVDLFNVDEDVANDSLIFNL